MAPTNYRKKLPWAHTQDKWVELEKHLLEIVSNELFFLKFECPHIRKALLVLIRTLHGHIRHLLHHALGLTLQCILDFALDNDKSVALTNVVHMLGSIGWALFPAIHIVGDNYSSLHSDIIALLGYNPEKHVGVVKRIISFIGKIAHRAISDMVQMQQTSVL